MHHALTISLIRIAFGMSMSDSSKEAVAMSEREKEDEIRQFLYGTVTLSEIRARVYPHIQYTTTLKD